MQICDIHSKLISDVFLLVKSLEAVLPIDHISPESPKLCVANLTRLVFVKQTCKLY